ncbi:hypothetical protein CAPTEDRAFT_221193 [Capitella teleta]|uniref:BZIP domain-containing protein n=1 Tax=Capitella teleta TaxID=283909 RepID=R7UBM8_CAPTE|nr:hypothetical protein CAPTEDRAFT_221193 [Capitella teleta]|eukprot:ELU03491.1 hypothetical protein CAPTEDRAFT_221193 [Capitella teleta]
MEGIQDHKYNRMIDPHPSSPSSASSGAGETLFFAVHYPPNSSKPELVPLGNTLDGSSFDTSMTSTVLDLSEVMEPSDEPLDLSTPTLRENLTMENSLREAMDPNVAMATLSAVSTGTITPLVKEELRCTIQQKRLSEGKEELMVDFDEREPCELSNADKERKLRRKERNRIAAQKCRSKRRQQADILQAETAELEDRNQFLQDEISKLEEERDRLMHMMRTHDIIPTKCNQKLSMSSDEGIFIPSEEQSKLNEDLDSMCSSVEDDNILDQIL